MNGITGKLTPVQIDSHHAELTGSLPGQLLRIALAARRRKSNGHADPDQRARSQEARTSAEVLTGRSQCTTQAITQE